MTQLRKVLQNPKVNVVELLKFIEVDGLEVQLNEYARTIFIRLKGGSVTTRSAAREASRLFELGIAISKSKEAAQAASDALQKLQDEETHVRTQAASASIFEKPAETTPAKRH